MFRIVGLCMRLTAFVGIAMVPAAGLVKSVLSRKLLMFIRNSFVATALLSPLPAHADVTSDLVAQANRENNAVAYGDDD